MNDERFCQEFMKFIYYTVIMNMKYKIATRTTPCLYMCSDKSRDAYS